MSERKKTPYKFLEHTADIKFQVSGETLNEIFENSVLAIANYVLGEKKAEITKSKMINVEGSDTESLYCNFLDEIIYLMDAENFISLKAKVFIRGNNLQAELSGSDTENYSVNFIKAATYAEMYVKKKSNGWEAQAVLDV